MLVNCWLGGVFPYIEGNCLWWVVVVCVCGYGESFLLLKESGRSFLNIMLLGGGAVLAIYAFSAFLVRANSRYFAR